MKNLNEKQERCLIYERALENLKKGNHTNNGLCYLLNSSGGDYFRPYDCHKSRLLEYSLFFDRPNQAYFEDDYIDGSKEYWKLRELILMFCIEMTKD